MNIEDYVCSAPPTSTLSGLDQCFKEIDTLAPIDQYLNNSRGMISYGTSDKLNEMSKLGGFLLLGLISSAEGYFRSILSATLDICPNCKNTAAEKQINLGGVLWHGKDEFRRSAFEHMSFTSSKEITTAAKSYLGFDMKGSIFNSVLKDFDTVCHLRHGLIHNAGILPGRNAVQIDIKPYAKPVEIIIDFAFLQIAAATLESFIITFNRTLFKELCHRWAISWRARKDWNPTEEKKNFMRIWNLFLSKVELKERKGKRRISPKECMARVKAEYNI